MSAGSVMQASQEYEQEYEAAKLEVEESWRDSAVKRAAENAARATGGGATQLLDDGAGGGARHKSRSRKYADDYEGLGAGDGVSGLESSQFDENGDVRDMCAPPLNSGMLSALGLFQVLGLFRVSVDVLGLGAGDGVS